MEALKALLLFIFLNPQAAAEYRAYRMTITNPTTGASRSVTSNFDPIQYRDLHPVLAEEEIVLERSWMCFGDTARKQVCPEPPETPQTLPKSDLN